jgi:hypothetical protein
VGLHETVTDENMVLTLYLMSSFRLSMIVRNPSPSLIATSPVLNHPSGVIADAVALGLFKYP